MFKIDRCYFCGVCLSRCHYLDFDLEKGEEEFTKLINREKVDWLHECITCMACNEYCPTGARPFDLILARLEEDGGFTDPALVDEMKDRFEAKQEPRPVAVKGRAVSLCVMNGTAPWAFQGQLFEETTIIKGLPYFCNVMFVHMGNESIMRSRLQNMVDNLARTGAEEIIFVHEDCYALLTDMASEYGIKTPFRPVHLFEYLRDYLREHSTSINKLNMKVAYQRPCASRYTPPEVGDILNDVFDMIGVIRVNRKYDYSNALCCGAEEGGPNKKLFPRGRKFEPFREKNIKDARDRGAEAMAYLCPMCFKSLNTDVRASGMKNYLISDLCRLALGEELPPDKPA
ncbi:MAG: (Fe-S)-binding protein [Syntrophomonadaceae bacterium]|nr:(Fe-S)-binding protein [Syntrophomonadaceae bacterium]